MEKVRDKTILFIITKSNFGGAQKYVYELACAIKEAGGKPIVAFGGTGEKGAACGSLANKLAHKNIPTYTVQNFMRNMSPLDDIRALYEIIKIIKKTRPDTLHVTSSKAGGLGCLAGRICGVKNIIFTSHGLTYQESWRPVYQRLAIKFFTWITLLLSHTGIMISKETYQEASSMPFVSKKIKLIYNGINPQLLVKKSEAQEILFKQQKNPKNIYIGGIGELHSNKNWILLLQSLQKLPENIHAIIIGEGEQRTVLENYINKNNLQDRVTLTGYINGASSLLSVFDIFVLPSKKEGLPYVLLEAGCAKLPVVCSKIPGNTDIIHHKKNGLLFEDLKELTEHITKLTQEPKLQKEYADNLYHKVTSTFSFKKMIEETLLLY